MQILKTNLIKKKFINDEKNPLEMKLTNKMKIMKNALKNKINITKTLFKKTKCRKPCTCETKYD